MSNKLVIVIVAVFVVIIGAMGAGFFVMWSKISTMGPPEEPAVEEARAEVPKIEKTGPLHPLETFIVNLADEGGNRYLRVTMTLEVKDDSVIEAIQKGLPQVRNAVLMILPAKKYEDIHTIEGKKTLRDQLLDNLNELMAPGSVTDIFFTEFVVQ